MRNCLLHLRVLCPGLTALRLTSPALAAHSLAGTAPPETASGLRPAPPPSQFVFLAASESESASQVDPRAGAEEEGAGRTVGAQGKFCLSGRQLRKGCPAPDPASWVEAALSPRRSLYRNMCDSGTGDANRHGEACERRAEEMTA